MGNNLFGADIAGKIANRLGPRLAAMTLIKRTPGTRTPSAVSAGTNPTERRFACRGVLSSRLRNEDGTLLPTSQHTILILGDTLPPNVVPELNDRIVAEGSTWNIGPVARDPDAAAYSCSVT